VVLSEEVLVAPAGDLLSDARAVLVRLAEVDSRSHAGVDDLVRRIREALEAARGPGVQAARAEGDPVGTEETSSDSAIALTTAARPDAWPG
jgi:hypothetical protein